MHVTKTPIFLKLTREVKTALLAIAAIALFIFGYSFLKGTHLLSSDRTFYAVYDDVGGLSSSSAIYINGFQVGKVANISFLNDQGEIIVTLVITKDFPFSKNSVAQIKDDGFIGGKIMNIQLGSGGELAASGDTLSGFVKKGMIANVGEKLAPLQHKVASAIVQIDSLMYNLNHLLDAETTGNLKSTIANLDATMTSFKNASSTLENVLVGNEDELNQTLANLQDMSGNFKQLSDTLTQINIKALASNLERTLANFEKISTNLTQGRGTLGKLLNDEAVYTNLKNATKQLEELLQDVKLNPGRYVHISVFGKKADEYKAPEDSLK